jgi:hypothetical protein
MKKNFKEINPELKKGDVVMLLHMEGESVPVGSRGFVVKKIVQPKYIPTDSGYGYKVEWYDIKNKLISKFPLFPESDGWVFDKKYYESNPENLQEDMFNNVDDLVAWGDFLTTFGKDDLNSICEFLELERRSGFFNMVTEGGRFLLSGRDYIKSFIKLKSFEINFDKKDKNTHKLLLSRAQEVRDIFIRGAMKYLEEKDQEPDIPNIQKTMQKLARTSKEWWMNNANKYLNKKIE